ncbi:MAG: tRNA (5-methylaminomethyl-2-thiouridine)(34)-methyltransferase MnmD [Tannerellaceae bacterium]|jgi:tRNA U34 5-methylaminomethyl-2-thiouridine-forming methyltransferase MnmC|nr:tRNA (5-methylaminomethyl-2-thiouridine)(34)-methyltransferase MnmD [Tannerellaceae bacterium]
MNPATDRQTSFRLEIQPTADGSDTLFVAELNEHYHSVHGAIQESMHVFIGAGLHSLPLPKDRIRVLEIGFGTGLNALLTLLEAEKMTIPHIEYHAVELYPLPRELTDALHYEAQLCPGRKGVWAALHDAPWDASTAITSRFVLHKIKGDSNCCKLPPSIDLVYFDAFAPEKQPEMWNPEIFGALYENMADGGLLTTYCAKGSVRRMMEKAGYSVERIPGPPGKREMLRARYSASIPSIFSTKADC